MTLRIQIAMTKIISSNWCCSWNLQSTDPLNLPLSIIIQNCFSLYLPFFNTTSISNCTSCNEKEKWVWIRYHAFQILIFHLPERSDHIRVWSDGSSDAFVLSFSCPTCDPSFSVWAWTLVAACGSSEVPSWSWDINMVANTSVTSKFDWGPSSKPNLGAIRIGLLPRHIIIKETIKKSPYLLIKYQNIIREDK